MTTKPRPQSAFQLNHSSSSTTTKTKTKTTTTTTANQASSDEGQDGDLELRRQQTLKTTLSGTAKTSLDWLWQKSGILGNWINIKHTGNIGIQAFWPTSLDKECDKCARILYTFTQRGLNGTVHSTLDDTPADERKTGEGVTKKIPTHIIQQAEGLAIFTVFRSTHAAPSASGSGLLISRDSPTTWGAPSGILIHSLDSGFLAGIDLYDVVLVLRTQKAVMSFAKPKVSLGPELAVVAGPIGNGVSFESGPEISPVFSYTKSKGIYGGLQLDGNIIEERTDENARFYGRKVKAEQILQGGAVAVPRAASGLIAVIDAAEGKAYDPEDFPPSIDVAPSEESMGVSTIRESRAKAAQDSGIVEMDEEADEEQQEEEETEVREPTKPDASSPRRRTMPPMAFHPASGSPGKATKQEPQPEPDEAVEADKENAPLAALTLVAPLAAPPPPPPRRRGLTVSRPPTEEGSTGPHSPTTLVPSRQDLPHQASQETIHPPPPPPPSSAPDLDSLSISDSVALLSNNSDKPPEPFLLHERSDSSHSITSPPKPSETEPSSSSSLASVPLS
ncbi:hypothetical protein PGTUg99_020731 [Puccinia graminis f. sp. tritici]|uniref:Ysc84 actin-binding domain-containing protein n=1 Tax=Puccinia graminis f. sp. tritici TaxID=56615 RepID=A0A5B0MUE1_PUCGR|nr:hypothetical protein PGTUg99_020731 [Puccinia graminis f. sp. tritici]